MPSARHVWRAPRRPCPSDAATRSERNTRCSNSCLTNRLAAPDCRDTAAMPAGRASHPEHVAYNPPASQQSFSERRCGLCTPAHCTAVLEATSGFSYSPKWMQEGAASDDVLPTHTSPHPFTDGPLPGWQQQASSSRCSCVPASASAPSWHAITFCSRSPGGREATMSIQD
eukprot:362120-Chlamydomonas_euryale.AAC.9